MSGCTCTFDLLSSMDGRIASSCSKSKMLRRLGVYCECNDVGKQNIHRHAVYIVSPPIMFDDIGQTMVESDTGPGQVQKRQKDLS